MKVVKYKEWNCNVVISNYSSNDRIAIVLLEVGTEEPIAIATTNLIYEKVVEKEVIIKSSEENKGIYETLLEAGVISEVKRYATSGFSKYQVCDLLIEI